MFPQPPQSQQNSNGNDVKVGEDFASSKWRPFMGWTYMAICFFDFVLGPIMNVVFSVITKTPLITWKSLTLDNGGLFHLAMGAVLGVAAYGRTQEKVTKMEVNSSPPPVNSPPMAPPMAGPPVAPPVAEPMPAGDPAPTERPSVGRMR